MADIFSKEKRSEIMSKIRSKDTRAEKIVFSHLRKRGVYFQRHYKRAVGSPDIALPRKKIAVFIDGDFWHGRGLERLKKDREADDYWVIKIETNVGRDRRQKLALKRAGWSVLRVWESDLIRKRTRDSVLDKIIDFLTK